MRQTTKHQSAWWASEVQTFWPVTTHSSPSSTALVWTLARSLPALGSEYPWHHSSVPARMGGRKRACCSGVPYWMRVGPSSPSPRTLTRPGALARTYSSLKMTWWAMDAPRPPCSTGQPMQVHPSAASTFSHSSRVSNPKVSSPEPPRPPRAANSPVTWSDSQARISLRKASSSGRSRRSMVGGLESSMVTRHRRRAGGGWTGSRATRPNLTRR